MRVAIGGISHESSTFTNVATTLDSFRERSYLHGAAIVERFTGVNTPIGGFIEGAEAHGFEAVPTMLAEAFPSAPTPRPIFDRLVGELLDGIEAAGAIDGVLLELHGAMVAEGIDDADGHILAAVRRLGRPGYAHRRATGHPLQCLPRHDRTADVLIGRETYPEVDMAPRGRECADVLVRMVREGVRPTMALHQLPLVWGMNQVTAHPPMRQAIEYLHRIEARPGVICGSIATCFPLADIPDMGASVYVATDNDLSLAQSCADELAAWIWERRADWQAPMPSTADALQAADKKGRYPVVLADRNDNTGGGSPGDSTGLLRTFLAADLQDACVLYIVDPEAVAACHEAGVGAVLDLEVGGKASSLQGEPCSMRAEVVALSDGRFRYDGPMYAGLDGTMGPSAHIRQGGVHVLLVNKREQPFCTAFSRTLGLDPKQMRYVGVKSAAHFRAGFEPWAGQIQVISEPSVHAPVDAKLAFKRLGRKLYPFDDI